MADKRFMVSLQGQVIVGVLVVVPYFVLTVPTTVTVDGELKEGVHVIRVVAVVQDRGCQVLTPLNKIDYLTTLKAPPFCLALLISRYSWEYWT